MEYFKYFLSLTVAILPNEFIILEKIKMFSLFVLISNQDVFSVCQAPAAMSSCTSDRMESAR